MSKCEFCGKTRKTAGTMFTGMYCVGCLRLVIEECKDAIKKIKESQ